MFIIMIKHPLVLLFSFTIEHTVDLPKPSKHWIDLPFFVWLVMSVSA